MTIDVEEMASQVPVADAGVPDAPVESDAPGAPAERNTQDLNNELESFLEIAKHKIRPSGETPCPACGLLVHIDVNVCPHCESFIAANNALMRECVRRLGEIQGRLDGDHADHARRERIASDGPSLGGRIRRFFSGDKQDDTSAPALADPTAPRLLRNTAEGDQLKVLEYDGPWFKVKTRDGQTGWVYSTLMDDR